MGKDGRIAFQRDDPDSKFEIRRVEVLDLPLRMQSGKRKADAFRFRFSAFHDH